MANASLLEIVWTVAFFIAFLSSLIAGWIVTYKYRQYRKPDVQGKRGNGAGVWIFRQNALLYIVLVIVTIIFMAVGILGMLTPEPIRTQNQAAANLFALIFITVAILMGLYSSLNLWIIFKVDHEIDKETNEKIIEAAKISSDRSDNISDKATNELVSAANTSDAAANASDSAANSQNALANASDAAANAANAARIANPKPKDVKNDKSN